MNDNNEEKTIDTMCTSVNDNDCDKTTKSELNETEKILKYNQELLTKQTEHLESIRASCRFVVIVIIISIILSIIVAFINANETNKQMEKIYNSYSYSTNKKYLTLLTEYQDLRAKHLKLVKAIEDYINLMPSY